MYVLKIQTNIFALLATVYQDVEIFKETLDELGSGNPHLQDNEIASATFLYTLNDSKLSNAAAYTKCLETGMDLFAYDSTLDLSKIFEKISPEEKVWTGILYSPEWSKHITPHHKILLTSTIHQDSITLPTSNLAKSNKYALKFHNNQYSIEKTDPATPLPFVCMDNLPEHFKPHNLRAVSDTGSKLQKIVQAMEKQISSLQIRTDYMKKSANITATPTHEVTISYTQTTLMEDFPQLALFVNNDRHNGVDLINLSIAATTLQNRLEELSLLLETLFENPLLIKKIGQLEGLEFQRPLTIHSENNDTIIIQLGQDIISQVKSDFFTISATDCSIFILGALATIIAVIKAAISKKPRSVYMVRTLPKDEKGDLPYYVDMMETDTLPTSKSPLQCCC